MDTKDKMIQEGSENVDSQHTIHDLYGCIFNIVHVGSMQIK